jgi:hypothetical protein
MKAQYVYENINFDRKEDPRDAMEIGDVLGRKIERIKKEGYSEESSSIEAIGILKRMLGNEWAIDTIGPASDTSEIILRKEEEKYRGPKWVIRDLGKKGQYISYGYNQPGQSTSKPFFRNKEEPLTWQELAIKAAELIHDKELKLPKHTIW